MDATFGRAGLDDKTTCLSDRAMGTELDDNANERLLLVGDVGVWGHESSENELIQHLA